MSAPEQNAPETQAPLFTSLGLANPILKAVSELGYESPSPIQAQSIPVLLAGKNLLGTAQTGTGKTAAFALPLLTKLDEKQRTPQILVLTPTRELAIQVAEAFKSYAKHLKQFNVLPIYGGSDIRTQLKGLQRGAQVIVGTPGRILDHLRRNSLDLRQLRALVLDEADEMLRMGFIDDVETILAKTPPECQRALFSATMPSVIKRVANTYLGDAEQISIAAKTRTVERISQSYLGIKHHHKMDALTRILEVEEFDGMIIFVRTKSATTDIADKLEARGFSAAALNGDLTQALREKTIDKLKRNQLDIIVATDVAARGLDVERISHVINFDIPYDNESYVHRIGRTGRAGREGKAILFVTPKEQRLLRSIEKSTRQPITPMNLPTNAEVSGQRIEQFSRQLMKVISSEETAPFKKFLSEFSVENELSVEDAAAALVWMAQKDRPLFPRQEALESSFSSNRGERTERPRKERGDRPERGERRERPQREDRPKREPKQALQGVDMVTYRIEVGHNDQIKPSNIVGAIANEADIESQYIGHIKLYDEFSTVELPAGMPDALLQHLQKVRVGPKLMRIAPLDKNAVLPESDRPARAPSKRPAKKSYAKSNDRGNDGTRPVKKKKYGKLKQGGKKAD
ncbi:DEAD/DEAH box helicase [Porticoccaceae bacterium]|nr:DEAD/DEAH box helicase [Porticoccaceae bacterium]